MRVHVVGSGAGDVALLVAGIVGATGEVVGVDRSETPLLTARKRAAQHKLPNLSFRVGNPAEMSFERPFDAVVGRYVLMFQPDPAATLRALARHVRPGGVIVFHEPYRANVHSFPPVAAYDTGCDMVSEAFRRSGADPLMGLKLYPTFLAAGLPPPTMRLESVIGGGANCLDQVHFEMDCVQTLQSEIECFGLAGDIKADTLADRVFAEVSASNGVVVGRSEIGAWCCT
jgi:SAM-dependent methyltransferase